MFAIKCFVTILKAFLFLYSYIYTPDFNIMINRVITDAIVTNFEEIRRRSIVLWIGMTPELYNWRPDVKAFSCLEMIRHVLECEHIYHLIINKRGDLSGDFVSP